jgi:hypothetical protein
MFKFFNFPIKKQKLNTLNFFSNNKLINNELISTSTFAGQFFANNRLTKKSLTLFSTNHNVGKFDQTVRKFANTSFTSGTFNLSQNLNSPATYLKFFNEKLNINLLTLNNIKNTK